MLVIYCLLMFINLHFACTYAPFLHLPKFYNVSDWTENRLNVFQL